MTADTQAPRLERCPFCNEPPERCAWQSDNIVCTGRHKGKEHIIINQSIDVWNTRRTDPVREALAKALETARRELWDALHSHMSEAEFAQEVDYIDAALHLHKGEG